jgi:hypothetical protein
MEEVMKIRRLIVMLGTAVSVLTSLVGMNAQSAHAAPAQGPLAQFCRVTFPVIAGYSRITSQLITENSYRCERRILGVVNNHSITVQAIFYQSLSSTPVVYKSTCIITYNVLPNGSLLNYTQQVKRVGTYNCEAADWVQGVQFIARAGF